MSDNYKAILHILIVTLVVTGGTALMILGFMKHQFPVYLLGAFIMISSAMTYRLVQDSSIKDKKDYD